jgi:general stress protein 26
MMAEKLKDKMDKYMKLKEKDHHLYVRIDEMLNLCVDWANLNEIWDRLCFQFGHFDSQILVSIVDDLKETGVLEVRDV